MVLSRCGNKRRLAQDLIELFPKHNLYIEPFFGAGGMFFNKPKAKYNIMNDIDSDVYNLYNVIKNKKNELKRELKLTPYHLDLWNYWKKNKETDSIQKAIRFLYLSNLGFLGQNKTMNFTKGNAFQIIPSKIDETYKLLDGVQFMNFNYKKMFKKISGINLYKEKTFIYCDPPYINTFHNYSTGFSQKDSNDLFDILEETNIKWGMSEFYSPFILNQVKQRGLNLHYVKTRANLRSAKTEIYICNYQVDQLSLFK